MAEMMRLQIVTPDEAFFDGEVSMVELNTADGEAGIYPKHIPMVVAVASQNPASGRKTSMAREPMKPGSAQRDVWRKKIHRPILTALKPL